MASTSTLPADLAPLVPATRTPLVILTATLALLALVAAWFSPAVLRPALVGSSGGQWSVELPESGTILVVSHLDPTAWPTVTIDAVEAIPGATPTAAWVFREPSFADEVPGETDPQRYLEASYSGLSLTSGGNLPATLDSVPGPDAGQLVIAVAWRIDDCATVVPDEYGPEPEHVPHALVHSSLVPGTSSTTLGPLAHPLSMGAELSDICG